MNAILKTPADVAVGPAHWFCHPAAQAPLPAPVDEPSPGLNLRLDPGQLAMLDTSAEIEIHCRCGTLWLTQYGSVRDIVLRTGQRYRLDAGSVAVAISALQAAGVASARIVPRGRGHCALRIGNDLRLSVSMESDR